MRTRLLLKSKSDNYPKSSKVNRASTSQHMDALREASLLMEMFVQPFKFYSVNAESWRRCRETIDSLTGMDPVARKLIASIYDDVAGNIGENSDHQSACGPGGNDIITILAR